MGVKSSMKLDLTAPDGTISTIEAELITSRGDFLSGTLRFDFKGPFPVDPLPFMHPPVPGSLPGGGFHTYEVRPPKATVGIKTGHNHYECSIESVRSDGFTLSPFMGVNMKALGSLSR